MKPVDADYLKLRVSFFDDCFAAERSLALLDSCYSATETDAASRCSTAATKRRVI